MNKCINVVGAVLVREGKILAAQRGKGRALAGMWEFPGGKIEANEKPEQALQRELKEELHIDARIGEWIETTEHAYDFGTVVLRTYYATLTGGDPELTEHAKIRWCTPAELKKLEWAPAHIPAVDKVCTSSTVFAGTQIGRDNAYGFLDQALPSDKVFHPALIVNSGENTMLAAILLELRRSRRFQFSVAFITTGALALLKQELLNYKGEGDGGDGLLLCASGVGARRWCGEDSFLFKVAGSAENYCSVVR